MCSWLTLLLTVVVGGYDRQPGPVILRTTSNGLPSATGVDENVSTHVFVGSLQHAQHPHPIRPTIV